MKTFYTFLNQLVRVKTLPNQFVNLDRCARMIKEEFLPYLYVTQYVHRKCPIMVLSNTRERIFDLIIAGHIDVVQGDANLFRITQKKDKLYGRGVFDMKGPLAASLYAVRDYVQSEKTAKKIAVFITADEELDGESVKILLSKHGYKARFALVPDGGSECEIVNQEKGLLQLNIDLRGKTCHAAQPWKSKNIIDSFFEFYMQMRLRYPLVKKDLWDATITPTKICAGELVNQTPKQGTMAFDIRYTRQSEKEKIIRIFKRFFSSSGITILAENPPLSVNPNNEFVQKLKKAIYTIVRKEAVITREHGTSDAVFFVEQEFRLY